MPYLYHVLTLVAGLLIGYFVSSYIIRRSSQNVLAVAEVQKKEILDEARANAQKELQKAQKKAKEIRDKELQDKKNAERDAAKKRAELDKLEAHLTSRIEKVDARAETLEKRADGLRDKEGELDKLRQNSLDILEQQKKELERVAGLTPEQAREQLMKKIEDELQYEIALKVNEAEQKIKSTSDKKSREVLATSIQRCATDHTIDPIVTVVELPSEEMKGRIIGREGRNIRAFESLTGVDVIIDDTPEAVVLSSFDPIKREIARVTLENLTLDGRIHPAKIEELYEKAQKEVHLRIKEAGEQTMLALGIQSIHQELVEIVGRLNYRTSYGQNVLQHSIEVANLASNLAAEIGADIQLARRAGLLHDIGKVIESDEGNHAKLGGDFARKYQESPKVVNAIAAHHEDVPFETPEAVLIAAADAISASRRGARSESLEVYIKRLVDLETIARSFKGVSSAYAIQAGREIRVMVSPEEVDDISAPKVCRDIVKKIESDMEYPGQVKVVLIRETRSVEVAH
ncbi:MAG: ribonuclease Y [Candidatus Riflebacteria bacterium HGW-Riflebacteria-2]|nr:MAG: ribonuclease Y [Candidatus Riflebacteria bacterium HGW-Riflebacteria-2]